MKLINSMLCLVAQSCVTLCDPVDYSSPGSSDHGILQARTLEWVAISSSRGSPHPGTEHRSPVLQADFLLSEPPWEPKNTGVGGISLLQEIFLTQESNQGLLPCGQILYWLSYQGSSINSILLSKINLVTKQHVWYLLFLKLYLLNKTCFMYIYKNHFL